MARHEMLRGAIRRVSPLMVLAGALALGGCYDDGYDGYGYAGGGYYGGDYGYAGFYDGWPGYGWYDGFYYPGSGYFVYDRRGGRHHWNGPDGRGWHGRSGGGHWSGHGGNWGHAPHAGAATGAPPTQQGSGGHGRSDRGHRGRP